MTSQTLDLIPGRPQRSLWDSLPPRVFFNLSSMETFRTQTTMVMVKIREALPSLPIDETSVGELPFGSLRLMTCAGMAVSYRIDSPRCRVVNVGANYAALALRDEGITEARVVFNDGTLLVMAGTASMVASIPSRRWIR